VSCCGRADLEFFNLLSLDLRELLWLSCPMVSMLDLEQLAPCRCQFNGLIELQTRVHAMCLLHCLTHTAFASSFSLFGLQLDFFTERC
jgi:hypothetical protein